MICTSPTVRLVNHCFTTRTSRTNRTSRAKRKMPLYGSYQFVYIGQPSLFWEKFFLKFVFSECNFTCVFISFFICQSTFFILLIFSAEYFSRFWTYTKHGPQVHGPPLWTRSMDHLFRPDPWTTPVDPVS